MANLRANKITSTEVFETTGSVQFDGSGDYLRIPNTVDFDFSGDFTLEMWFHQNSNASRQDLIGNYVGSSSGWGVGTNYDNTNDIIFYHGNTIILNSSSCYDLKSWNNLTVCRSSGTLRLFINGILVTSISDTTNLNSTRDLMIGGVPDSSDNFQLPFNGFISNLRILKGTALYTKNFTPPTRELTVIPNTVLLACTSTTNTAQEATGKTITVNGNAVANELTPGLLTDVVKSGGSSAITGSVEFTGTQDALVLSAGQDFAYGTGDFTIEAWIQPQGLNGGETKAIFTQTQSGNDYIVFKLDSDKAIKATFGGTTITGGTVEVGSWNHVAVTRASNTVRVFVNGVASAGTTVSTDFSDTTRNPTIGQYTHTYGNIEYYGFISNLRVLKGQALYTGSFIPPSRELKKIPNTVLLCCKNSSDPTAEETGKTITANGDPAASNFTPQIGSDGSVTFDGVTKINTQNYFYLPTGNTENRGRGRGLFGGGYVPGTSQNTIQFINIQSSGSAIDFGDLSSNMGSADGKAPCAAASSTRALFANGYSAPAPINTIEFITIATTSNSTDFGDLLTSRRDLGACSSSTRALFGGGTTTSSTSTTNVIEYVTIASLGNAVSFGTLTQARRGVSSCSSSTRGIFGGGYITASPTATFSNSIDFVTIATTGNATTFGNLQELKQNSGSVSSSVRGIFAGGASPTLRNTIDFVTISTLGNAQDFGDLTIPRLFIAACSNSIRGVFGGGLTPTHNNTMDFIVINSTGNAQDFGDLLSVVGYMSGSGCSDSHGGLS